LLKKAHACFVALATRTTRSRVVKAVEKIFVASRVAGISGQAGIASGGAKSALTGVIPRTEQSVLTSSPRLGASIRSLITLIITDIAALTGVTRTSAQTASANICGCTKEPIVT
jgi:hypothetical protein